MNDVAAFQGTYSMWRVVRGRSVVQITIEVPIEGADVAYNALGGMPAPGEEIWVAVARLDKEKSMTAQVGDTNANPS